MPYRDKEKNIEKLRAYRRKHYRENKEQYLTRNVLHKEKLKEILRVCKDGPCHICGHKFHFSAMDFDHPSKATKINNVGYLIRFSEEKLIDEIEKCKLICANCHRIKTFMRHDYAGATGW